MGLNMPARTVLFTSARKFDGKDNRYGRGTLVFARCQKVLVRCQKMQTMDVVGVR